MGRSKKNTSLKKFVSTSITFDTYHNNGFSGDFKDGVQGLTNDSFGGYGIFGSYSKPVNASTNAVDSKAGFYKSSFGVSTPGFSLGSSRTKTINITNL